MLNLETLARPYARAAYDAARGADAVVDWGQALALASTVFSEPEVRRLAHDPRVAPEQVFELFAAVGGERFAPPFGNFLRILLKNDRVDLLPEITAQFEMLRAEAEQRIKVRVASVVALDDEQQARLCERLAKRYGREVDLENEIDPELIAGLVIHAGDQVIDGSVRGRLNRLALEMNE